MLNNTLKAGDIIVSDFGFYQHWSIVSDTFCDKGIPMLISATERNGTVKEEPWDIVTQGKHSYPIQARYIIPVNVALSLAKSQIGKWKYSVISSNCEHFVRWATRLNVSSTQVIAGTSGVAAGLLLVALFAKNPKLLKYLGGAVAIGAFAVLNSRATIKSEP
ncbi:lecithin retinol acyltransferase family protein [Kangiella sp.]|uniref:lecithin retinol acyltransferase family protein n=1 Tax=Kangiella sp. TaxID=1920245 RepID=UPI003A953DFB